MRAKGRHFAVGALVLGALASSPVSAARVDFTIENLTHAITFRPFLLAAHRPGSPMFRVGEPASPGLQVMAECGGLDPLLAEMTARGADVIANPVNDAQPFDPPLGLLFPAGTTDPVVPFEAGLPGKVSGTLFTSKRNTHLSVAAMLLPTNDAFAGLESVRLPKKGTLVLFLPAYDAGTEANNELRAAQNPLECAPGEDGYPIDPLGNDYLGGTGVSADELNNRVHIHRNQLGDLDEAAGPSDLDSRIHRWLNPVIKLTLRVSPSRGGKHHHKGGHNADED